MSEIIVLNIHKLDLMLICKCLDKQIEPKCSELAVALKSLYTDDDDDFDTVETPKSIRRSRTPSMSSSKFIRNKKTLLVGDSVYYVLKKSQDNPDNSVWSSNYGIIQNSKSRNEHLVNGRYYLSEDLRTISEMKDYNNYKNNCKSTNHKKYAGLRRSSSMLNMLETQR